MQELRGAPAEIPVNRSFVEDTEIDWCVIGEKVADLVSVREFRGKHAMTRTLKSCAAAAAFLATISAAGASPCSRTIASVQSQIDAAIENDAGLGGWEPESLRALRSYQPTPRSLAATEGRAGRRFEDALVALRRARSADRATNATRCLQEVRRARAALAE